MADDGAPIASSHAVRRRMKNTLQRDTGLELTIRKELHRRGYRYRLHPRLPGVTRGIPDFAFMAARVAVFVDGCFWHACPQHGSLPKTNRAWWAVKLDMNVRRDRRHDEELRDRGWCVVRVWEHEDLNCAVTRVERALHGRG